MKRRNNLNKLILIVIMIFSTILAVGCSDEKENEKKYSIILPAGTPLIALGDLIDNPNFDFTIVNGQDPLLTAFTQNEYDLIIAPINLGAKLFISETSQYKMKAIITTNNTYLISKNEINSINDLSNKKVLAFGNGSAPALALSCALDINKIDCEVNYKNSAADVITMYTSLNDDNDYYLSAEPNITKIEDKTNKSINKLDVSEIIKEEVPVLIQACLFVNPNSNVDEKIISLIKENINTMNELPSEYAKKIINKNEFFTGLGESVLTKCIPNSNIKYLDAIDNMENINKYFTFLNKYLNKVLGGKVPSEEFYK